MKNRIALAAAVIPFLTAFFPVTASFADIYRWVNKDSGEIFFSETPPPPEVAIDYENITADLQKSVLKKSHEVTNSNADINSPGVNLGQSTVSGDNPDSEEIISDHDLLILRRCDNFNQQIDRLEFMVSKAVDPNEMDKFIVKLAEYEKSYAEYCK